MGLVRYAHSNRRRRLGLRPRTGESPSVFALRAAPDKTAPGLAFGSVRQRKLASLIQAIPDAVPGVPDTGHASKAVMSCAQSPALSRLQCGTCTAPTLGAGWLPGLPDARSGFQGVALNGPPHCRLRRLLLHTRARGENTQRCPCGRTDFGSYLFPTHHPIDPTTSQLCRARRLAEPTSHVVPREAARS